MLAIPAGQTGYSNPSTAQAPRFGNLFPLLLIAGAAAAAKNASEGRGGSYAYGSYEGPGLLSDLFHGKTEEEKAQAKITKQVGKRQKGEAKQCKGYVRSLQRAMDDGKIRLDGKPVVEEKEHETITRIPMKFGDEAYELQIWESIGSYRSYAFQSRKRVPDSSSEGHTHPAKGLSIDMAADRDPQVWSLDFEGAKTQSNGEDASYVFATSDSAVREKTQAFMDQVLKLAGRDPIGSPPKTRFA